MTQLLFDPKETIKMLLRNQSCHYQSFLNGFTLCEKCQIRNFSGPYFPVFGLNKILVQMPENTDQKNSVFVQFLRNVKTAV